MTQPHTPEGREAADQFTEQLVDVVTRLSAEGNPSSPELVVQFAAQALPHAEHSGLTLLRPNRAPATIAASDELPREVDALQYRLREGPCLDAAVGPPVLICDDLATDERWPQFGPRCTEELGVRSILSLRLPVGGDDFGGINYYSTKAAAFTRDDVTVASVIVPLAALALEAHLREHDYENLTRALESSRHISTAVGIVMATHRVTSEEAFALLRRASMDLNKKLSQIADEINLTGALPMKPGQER